MWSFNFIGEHSAWLGGVFPSYKQLFVLPSLDFSTLLGDVVKARSGRNAQIMITCKSVPRWQVPDSNYHLLTPALRASKFLYLTKTVPIMSSVIQMKEALESDI